MSTNSFGFEKPIYNLREVKAITGSGRTSLYKYAKKGDLLLSKMGRKTVIFADDLAAFLTAVKLGKLK